MRTPPLPSDVKKTITRAVKRLLLFLPLLVLVGSLVFVGCAGSSPGVSGRGTGIAKWLSHSPNINWLPRQVSGRYDGASALDNIRQASQGQPAKRSSYGTAPGGYVRLHPKMLYAMKKLAQEGYRFRVTALAGASHSSRSRHYAGLAFDIDHMNGMKIGYSHPHWRTFLRRCRELGATETLGPGDGGHSNHIHVAWPRSQ